VALYSTPEQTHALGRRLGHAAQPGCCLALRGELGAGKTVLAKGVGAGLGVRGLVTSPTFVLLMLHEDGRLPLHHADLYRLGDAEEAELVGLPEILGTDGVAVVEWADRFPEILPADLLWVEISWVSGAPGQRRIQLRATGPLHRPLEALLHDGA